MHNSTDLIGLIDLIIERNENLTPDEIRHQQEIQRKIAKQNVATMIGGSAALGIATTATRIGKNGITMVNPLGSYTKNHADADAVSPTAYLRNKFTQSGLTSDKNILQGRKIFTNSQGENPVDKALQQRQDFNTLRVGKKLANTDPGIKGIEDNYQQKLDALKTSHVPQDQINALDKQHLIDLQHSEKVTSAAKQYFGSDPMSYMNASSLAAGTAIGAGLSGANWLLKKGLQKYQEKKYGIKPPPDIRTGGQKVADVGRAVRNIGMRRVAGAAGAAGAMTGAGLMASSSVPLIAGAGASLLASPAAMIALPLIGSMYAAGKVSKLTGASKQKIDARRRIQYQISNLNQNKTMDPTEKRQYIQQLRQQMKEV